jgi:hypothetical protein
MWRMEGREQKRVESWCDCDLNLQLEHKVIYLLVGQDQLQMDQIYSIHKSAK